MIPSSISLPIVVIFERHWDQEPKKLVKDLIPELSEEGYDTLCLEFPQDLIEEKFLSCRHKGLEFDIDINSQAYKRLERVGIKNITLSELGFEKLSHLMKLYVSSQMYFSIAEKIKGLAASMLLKEILNDTKKRSFSIKGVDLDANDFEEILPHHDPIQRMDFIEKHEVPRISAFFKNLSTLYKSGRNIIFVCGALHAENLINKFTEKGMQNQVLYYFPHSDNRYDESTDDIKEIFSNDILKNHTFCLIDDQSRTILKKRIITEIKSKNVTYKEEIIEGTCHSKFLSTFFNTNFKAYLRPGYYVDALLDTSDRGDCEQIIKKLNEANISTDSILIEGRNHLVIKDVNTKKVADKICSLS